MFSRVLFSSMTLVRRDLQIRHCLSLTYTSVWSERSVLSHICAWGTTNFLMISRAHSFHFLSNDFVLARTRYQHDTSLAFSSRITWIAHPLPFRKNAMKIKFFNRELKSLLPLWDTRHEYNRGLIMIAVGAAKIYAIDLISVWISQNIFLAQEFVPLKNKSKKQKKNKEKQKKKARKGMSGIIIFKLINSRRFSMDCYLYINFACL